MKGQYQNAKKHEWRAAANNGNERGSGGGKSKAKWVEFDWTKSDHLSGSGGLVRGWHQRAMASSCKLQTLCTRRLAVTSTTLASAIQLSTIAGASSS